MPPDTSPPAVVTSAFARRFDERLAIDSLDLCVQVAALLLLVLVAGRVYPTVAR
jgi:hypothetical protein